MYTCTSNFLRMILATSDVQVDYSIHKNVWGRYDETHRLSDGEEERL